VLLEQTALPPRAQAGGGARGQTPPVCVCVSVRLCDL